MLYSKDAPSSARNGPRKSSVQECTPSLSENATSKMLGPGPFGCAGEGEMIIAVFSLRQSVSSVLWVFGRCVAAELRAPDVAVDANGGGAGA